MSEIRLNTWRYMLLDQDRFESLHRNSNSVIAITKCSRSLLTVPILDSLKRDSQIEILAICSIEGDIFFIHSTQELSGEIVSNVEDLVGIEG